MSESPKFSFSSDLIASSYDNMLVPILFKPWATRLIEDFKPWEGRRVLDLATGTGIVAQYLKNEVGHGGKVFATDISPEMLELAANRCNGSTPAVKFIECPAYPLDIPNNSIDFVLCQQGFQFFPDKNAAIKEIYRVLISGGQVVITIWCPVGECQFFGAICNALNEIGEPEIAAMMRIPFDDMPVSEIAEYFESAGFINVRFWREEQDLVIEGGVAKAIEIAYSTPIGSKLRALPDEIQTQFRRIFSRLLSELSDDGIVMGSMVSNVLSAEKPIG